MADKELTVSNKTVKSLSDLVKGLAKEPALSNFQEDVEEVEELFRECGLDPEELE